MPKARKQPKILKEVITPGEDEEPEDPILDEIETLFDKIKESGIIISKFEEEGEIIASNLIVAYYLSKLERKLK